MPSLRLFPAALVLLSCDASTAPPWRVYRVGDETLSHVALKTNVSVARLRSINHLSGDTIGWGTGLLVPDSEKTQALPRWKPPKPAPGWQPCAQVEWVPVVSLPPHEKCLRRACAGPACTCLTSEDGLSVDVSLGAVSWTASMFPMSDPAPLLHARVDLDGDGAPESVVSLREGVGNGLGLEWWRHMVVKDGRPIASFITLDYGASFVAQPHGCALLATSFESRDDQLRGYGSYWVARLHVLAGGAMRAVGPEVVRRYTRRFADQRWAGVEGALVDPLPWFTDVGAFSWPEPDERRTCHETNVVFEDEEARFDLGVDGLFERREYGREEPLPAGLREYDQVLDRVTGAPLLEEYRPFGEARWSGHRVTVCDGVADGAPRVTLGL